MCENSYQSFLHFFDYMTLLPHQQAFVDSDARVTVLCGQRASGRSFAAYAAEKEHGIKHREFPRNFYANKLRGMSSVVIDDFDLIDFNCSVEELAAVLKPVRMFLTIEQRPLGHENFKSLRFLSMFPDKKVIFSGTHENTFMPPEFCEKLYLPSTP